MKSRSFALSSVLRWRLTGFPVLHRESAFLVLIISTALAAGCSPSFKNKFGDLEFGDLSAEIDPAVLATATISIVAGDGQTDTVGQVLGTPLIVVVRDSSNNPLPSAPINWAVTVGNGSLWPATSTTDSSGVTSAALTLGSTAGANAVTATIRGTATSVTFNATGTAGAVSQLAFTTQPSATGDTDTDLAAQPVVTAQDALGNTITGYGSAITLSAFSNTNCTGAVPGGLQATTNPETALAGVATFAGVRILKTNVRSIQASDGTRTVCSNALSISAGAAATLVYTTEPSATGTAGGALAQQPVVVVRDSNGNTVTGSSATVALSLYSDNGCTTTPVATTPDTSASLGGTTSKAASSGVATFTDIAVNKALATLYLKATSAGLTSDCSSVMNISPGAFSLTDSTLGVSAATVASAASITVTLTALDAYGNADPSGITAVTFSSTAVGGTGSFGATNDAGSGVYTASFTGDVAGAVTLSGLINTSAISDTEAITVTAAGAAKLAFTTQPSATGTAGGQLAQQPVVKVQDAAGNTVTGSSAAIALSLYSDSGCTTTAVPTTPDGTASVGGTTGPNAVAGVASFSDIQINKSLSTLYLKATSAGLTSACSSLMNISPGAFSLAESTLGVSAATVLPGSSITVTLTAKDTYGNANPSGITAVTFDSTTNAGTGTFGATNDAGSGVYTASFTGNLQGAVTLSGLINASTITDTEAITVTAIALASATISNTSPTNSTTYNLTYGAVTGTQSHYCVLENDTTLANCTFVASATLPSTKVVSATENAKVLSFWIKDTYGNVSARVDTNSVTLDTSAPTSNSISIAGGNLNTSATTATLTLASTGAAEMYITNTAGCGSGGNWEAYAVSKAGWTLADNNQVTNVYAKFKDTAGNESACVSDSIYQGNGTIFSDDFNDNAYNTAIWNTSLTDNGLETSQTIRFSPPANNPGGDYKFLTGYNVDLTDAVAAIEAVQVLNSSTDSETVFRLRLDADHHYIMYTTQSGGVNQLYFEFKNGAGVYDSTQAIYSAVSDRFWRMRHNSTTGKVYWDTSADGTTWVERRAVTAPFAVTSLRYELMGGTGAAVAVPGTFIFDNAYVKKGVASNFSGNWTFAAAADYTYNSTLMDFTGGVVRLTAADQTDDGNTASGFGGGTTSGVSWDAANSYLRLTQTGTPTNNASFDESWTPQWSSLVSYWKTDNDWNDSKGASNGTANGGATFTTSSKIGSHAGSFDGTNDYVSFGNAAALTPTTAITLSAWVYVTNAGNQGSIFYHGGGWTDSGYQLLWCTDPAPCPTGEIRFELQNTGTAEKKTLSTPLPSANAWHHMVATWDSVSRKMRLYINGQAISSTTNFTGPIGAPPVNLEIGRTGTLAYFLAGRLDDLAIWSTALSAAEVATIYERQSAKYSGTITSRVMDAFATGMSWTTLSWVPTLPFFKELPDAACAVPPCVHPNSESSTNYSALVGSAGNTGDDNLMSGIVGLWHLDETSPAAAWGAGTIAFRDDSGNENHAQYAGGPAAQNPVAGRFGNGVLTPVTANVAKPSISTLTSVNLTNTFTASYWIRGITFDDYSAFSRHLNTATNRWSITWSGGAFAKHIHIRIDTTGGANQTLITNASFGDGKWHHIVAVVDNGAIRLYADGALDTSGTYVPGAGFSGSVPFDILWGNVGTAGAGSFVLDEVGYWSRALHASEIRQLYRRGANRLKYQVRVCTASDCSDDATGANWKGPDGSRYSYFSELHNNSVALDYSGDVKKTLPSMLFSAFTSPVGTSRYFQYRAILESDDAGTGCNYGSGATWCSPELKSVTVDPVHYASTSPTVVGNNGLSFYSLSTLAETLGANGCSSGATYNLSLDKVTWYYWTGAAWAAANGTVAQSNTAAVITTNAATFGSTVGRGTIYFKAFLGSSGTSQCELDNLGITGTHQ